MVILICIKNKLSLEDKMTNDGAVRCRDKLPDRLRLHIVEMARRSDEIFQHQNASALSRTDTACLQKSSKDRTGAMNYSAYYPIVNQKRERINLDLVRGNEREQKLASPRRSSSKEKLFSPRMCKDNISRDMKVKAEVANHKKDEPTRFPKRFIYDDVRNAPVESSNVPVYYVTDLKAVNNIVSSLKPGNFWSKQKLDSNNTSIGKNANQKNVVSPRQQTVIGKCEVKGNACLSPRNHSSAISSQPHQGTGLFSASLMAIKRRRNGVSNTFRRPVFKEEYDRVEDYVIRAETKESNIISPRQNKISTSPRQNLDSKLGNKFDRDRKGPSPNESLRPRTALVRISPRNNNNHPGALNTKFDSREHLPSFDKDSISSEEPFRCSYRLPESFKTLTESPLAPLQSEQTVACVKTYVLENNRGAQVKPDVAPLTSHNLQVHDAVMSSSNPTTNCPYQPQSSSSFNTTTNSNGMSYYSDYLEPSEYERISTWLNGVATETRDLNKTQNYYNLPTELVQSCHGANGSAVAFMTKSTMIYV